MACKVASCSARPLWTWQVAMDRLFLGMWPKTRRLSVPKARVHVGCYKACAVDGSSRCYG